MAPFYQALLVPPLYTWCRLIPLGKSRSKEYLPPKNCIPTSVQLPWQISSVGLRRVDFWKCLAWVQLFLSPLYHGLVIEIKISYYRPVAWAPLERVCGLWFRTSRLERRNLRAGVYHVGFEILGWASEFIQWVCLLPNVYSKAMHLFDPGRFQLSGIKSRSFESLTVSPYGSYD